MINCKLCGTVRLTRGLPGQPADPAWPSGEGGWAVYAARDCLQPANCVVSTALGLDYPFSLSWRLCMDKPTSNARAARRHMQQQLT
jgi:hypothetical protein